MLSSVKTHSSTEQIITCADDVYKDRESLSGTIEPVLIIPIGTFCLGTWQLQRRKWKLNLIAELQAKSNVPPVDLPLELSELEDLEFQRVKMTGSFDHSKEVFLGPRPLLVGGDVHEAGSGLISSGQSGYLVVTPFKLADRDLTVLVNRGWVPRKQKNPESRLEGQIEGLVEVTAVVRRGENRAPFMPNNTKGSPIFTFRDVPTMARMLGTAPVFLDATDTFPGGPQGGQTRVTMRNEHLSYMMTWYSLSLATSYLWYRRFIMGKALM
ncbi:surfeit locus protein 1-like isoform X2 [Homarus americanus]|uniref:surfeit locus protein 1-like isoform X2 n=1 Tax=Homarus americanus TaxID=6706 RepID=UPI001C49606F|nr:surfeit locus protein 1-like isoform X2 [Homarus americanus]XP_042215337.1 surfeit locus protein 1-like isoform X2 [Homarus americanus]XP_042215338.1 surfeit locus protein 1-like isoform X2 [Homarus americanus]XP_042215339.1 surfeit locus protein 1-like isoform X2 [Homarus americanus]XP_042215340.1 surfeit locus protein 1-like isoform X2 [Homarus americanus]XP_042215341.1 surfeit locus protein 1-like isoform X2 [Homarus americanus]XP_042215342.1 surfeit locus protein 1-like isoform X2 [Hom